MLFGRFLLAYRWPGTMIETQPSTEWLRGSKLCTYRGKFRSKKTSVKSE
jgi:hypothetical protein